MAETTVRTDDDLFRERMRLSGDLSGLAYQYLCDQLGYGGRTIDGEKYELADEKEYAALGYNPEDPWGPLVVRRQSDGQCFELDIEVDAHRVQAKADAAKAAPDGN